MVAGDDHAITNSTFAKSGLEISNAFVSALGIIFVGADGRSLLASAGLVFPDTEVGDLRLAVHHGRNLASGGVLREFGSVGHLRSLFWKPNHRGDKAGCLQHYALPICFAL